MSLLLLFHPGVQEQPPQPGPPPQAFEPSGSARQSRRIVWPYDFVGPVDGRGTFLLPSLTVSGRGTVRAQAQGEMATLRVASLRPEIDGCVGSVHGLASGRGRISAHLTSDVSATGRGQAVASASGRLIALVVMSTSLVGAGVVVDDDGELLSLLDW